MFNFNSQKRKKVPTAIMGLNQKQISKKTPIIVVPKSPILQTFTSTNTSFSNNASIKTDIEINKETSHAVTAIPLNLFQTWYKLDLPDKMRQNVNLLKSQNPEFSHFLYDDNMCRSFIENNFEADVLWAYDKLIPGAFKADVWRYCILYIKGGIYLDIKFHCVNNFKLITLTEKENWVSERDQFLSEEKGIYQALLISMPYNEKLKCCIDSIVTHAKTSYYGVHAICVTGPALLGMLFKSTFLRLNKLKYSEDGQSIVYDKMSILQKYREYEGVDQINTPVSHYSILHKLKQIYNYPCLRSLLTKDFTAIKSKNVYESFLNFYSSTPFIALLDDENMPEIKYLVITRYVNYKLNENGSFKYFPKNHVTINKIEYLNKSFAKVEAIESKFLVTNFNSETVYNGVEDVRLFTLHDGSTIYIGTVYDALTKHMSITSGFCNKQNPQFPVNIIRPTFKNYKPCIEKNWVPFLFRDKLQFIYKWFPVQVCSIDYTDNTLNVDFFVYNVPSFFENLRGGSPGYYVHETNETWFIVHTKQFPMDESVKNYQHLFIVFNEDMSLNRYSESFKLQNKNIEFCSSLLINTDTTILSYSTTDSSSFISTYDNNYIKNNIRWYDYKTE
jgi:hypothetical protein